MPLALIICWQCKRLAHGADELAPDVACSGNRLAQAGQVKGMAAGEEERRLHVLQTMLLLLFLQLWLVLGM